ncbi:MAG TPA: octanoyltransferase [Gammaproteobacteria bacterium]|nr:octanoyltransferase [Gammaproteobacteria bacterium]
MSAPPALTVRHLGLTDYESAWHDMQTFTDNRKANTPDELWFLEHPPVFTLGRNGKQKYLHNTGSIPVINTDRGGQVTYHGPGQLVAYTLLNIKRRQLGVQSLVRILEQTVMDLLADYSLSAQRRDKAPGVYVDDRKLAALGLRVRKGCAFHGLSLNVDMDLSPFAMIDPCGYSGLEVTQLRDLGINATMATISTQFQKHLERLLDKPAP